MAKQMDEWIYRPASGAVDERGAALGNTAGKVSAQERRGVLDSKEIRKEKFELREIAQKNNPKNFLRLNSCGKKIIFGRDVEINLSSEGRAFFSGVETCGNPWACPVCSPKIQYVRGQEIGKAVDKARGEGLKVSMLTFTHPHYKGQPLARLIDMHNLAVKKFRSGRWFMGWKEKIIFLGSITAAEVNYGDNGWHWHTHALYISEGDSWDDEELKERWVSCLRAVGFSVNEEYVMEHGLDVMRDCHASDYLQKMGMGTWGAERELTGNHRKEAGKGGKTPFQLLKDGDIEHWQEYVIATKGRKQLVWSKGLKDWACICEKTDEEIAEDQDQERVEKVATIPQVEWWQIVRAGWRLALLEALERGGVDCLKKFAKEKKLMLLFASPLPQKYFGGEEVLEVIA